MKDWENFHNITKDIPPRKNVIDFINTYKLVGDAIDLGCGAGNDTVYLIKNNWNVLAIDGTNSEMQIRNKLSNKEQEKLTFQVQNFENLKLKKVDLIIANNSLPFCNKEYFYKMWKEISFNIKSNGFFVGNFFGLNDEWNIGGSQKTFLSKKSAIALFKDFEIIKFLEIEKDRPSALGVMKHWHIFEIVAKKI